MYKFLIVFPVLASIYIIFTALNTPEKNDDVVQILSNLEKEKINLIIFDYNNIVLYPIKTIKNTFLEYNEILSFIKTSFDNFEATIINSEYNYIVDTIYNVIIKIEKILEVASSEIDELKNNVTASFSYDLFDIILEKIIKIKFFMISLTFNIVDLKEDIYIAKQKIASIKWSGNILIEKSDKYEKAVKPLVAVFLTAVEIISKVIDGLENLFNEKSFFSQRLNYMNDMTQNWKNICANN